jgi:hypothetical protein
MRPNFNDPLNLKNNSQTVQSGGPCNWDNDDDYAEIANVVVQQGGVTATSNGTVRVSKANDPNWWLPAQSPNQLQRGGARADAVATVHKTNGQIVPVPWGEDLQLN